MEKISAHIYTNVKQQQYPSLTFNPQDYKCPLLLGISH